MESHTIIDRYLKDEIINGLKQEAFKTHRAYLVAVNESKYANLRYDRFTV